MTKLALFGACGKMGMRRGANLAKTDEFETMHIMGAVMFDQHQGVFSDAANKAIEFGIPVLMKDDWLRCFDDDEIAAGVERIT